MYFSGKRKLWPMGRCSELTFSPNPLSLTTANMVKTYIWNKAIHLCNRLLLVVSIDNFFASDSFQANVQKRLSLDQWEGDWRREDLLLTNSFDFYFLAPSSNFILLSFLLLLSSSELPVHPSFFLTSCSQVLTKYWTHCPFIHSMCEQISVTHENLFAYRCMFAPSTFYKVLHPFAFPCLSSVSVWWFSVFPYIMEIAPQWTIGGFSPKGEADGLQQWGKAAVQCT